MSEFVMDSISSPVMLIGVMLILCAMSIVIGAFYSEMRYGQMKTDMQPYINTTNTLEQKLTDMSTELDDVSARLNMKADVAGLNDFNTRLAQMKSDISDMKSMLPKNSTNLEARIESLEARMDILNATNVQLQNYIGLTGDASGTASHKTSDIPADFQPYTKFSCYWELRDKYGLGPYFSPELVCQMTDLPAAITTEACACYDTIRKG